MADSPEISEDVLNSLAAKLEALDLTDAEQAVLDGILERAEAYEPDVEGFAFDQAQVTGMQSGANLSGMALKLGGGLGFITRPSLGYGTFDPNDPTRPPPP
jgi:hypothetical protein